MSGHELKNCPFCGGIAKVCEGPNHRWWGTICDDCGVWRDDRHGTQAEAIAAWNRRTPDPAQIQADALRGVVGKHVIDPAQPAVGSIWRHLKSGHIYRVIACGLVESNLTPSVIYTNINPDSDPLSAANWIRPMVDFRDGRFALIATPLSPTAVDGSPAPDAGGKEGV